MYARFMNLRWEKGTVSFVAGNSNYRLPQGTIRASNGTYIVPNSAKLYLTILAEDGRTITTDIANFVKRVNGWDKISDKRFNNLRDRLENQKFQLDDKDNIVNLGALVMF